MKLIKVGLQTAAIALLLVSALSNSAEARRDQLRQAKQKDRIAEGVATGEITKFEGKKLRRQQIRIDRAQMKANKDGVVTNEEKAKLEQMQNRASRNIYLQKHDGQKNETPETPKAAEPTPQ